MHILSKNLPRSLRNSSYPRTLSKTESKQVTIKQKQFGVIRKMQKIQENNKPELKEYFIRKQVPLPSLENLALYHQKEIKKVAKSLKDFSGLKGIKNVFTVFRNNREKNKLDSIGPVKKQLLDGPMVHGFGRKKGRIIRYSVLGS